MPLLERDHLLEELSSSLTMRLPDAAVSLPFSAKRVVGKTSLLDETARRPRIRTIATGCEALFTPRPLGPLYDIAGDLRVDLEDRRERLFPAVLAEVARTPTLLIVEDVHWADRATLDLLKYVGRRIARTPVLLAISYRDDEVGADHPLINLLGETAVKRLRVEPPVARSGGEAGRAATRSPPANRRESVLRDRGTSAGLPFRRAGDDRSARARVAAPASEPSSHQRRS